MLFDVTISLRITDRSALYRAALAAARKQGLPRSDWREIRNDPSHSSPTQADLQMLLDPGGLDGLSHSAGFEVIQTTAAQPVGEEEEFF